MSKRRYGEYTTLKEARAAARAEAFWRVVPIYEEPDSSYSIKNPYHKKAKLVCGVDKSGRRYKLVLVRDCIGRKIQKFEPIK